MMGRLKEFLTRLSSSPLIPQVLFWSWNAIFFSVVYLGMLPYILWDLLWHTLEGPTPWDFTLFSCLLLFIPVPCVIFAAIFLRKQPRKLMGLFYGIEAPLFLLCLCRLFLVREMTPGVGLLLALFYIAAFFYLHELVKGYVARPFTAHVQLIGHTVLLLCGLLMAALAAFYVPPLLFVMLKGFFSFSWIGGTLNMIRYSHGMALILIPLGCMLFGYTALLFIGSPLALIVLALRSFRRIAGQFSMQFGAARTLAISGAVVGTIVTLFIVTNRQPQGHAFALLQAPPRSDGEREQRLAQESQIRLGLINAYLSPFRYLSAVSENDHVAVMYRETFKLDGALPDSLQAVYNQLARPFLFQGHSIPEDQRKAEELYEAFFDTPIQKGERDAVLRALEATYSREQREAGLLNQGQQKVWLARQEVTTQPHGDWADIELHEVYENQTYEQQEIFYYFSLPESAAVTGLWLGDTDEKSRRFAFTVAPRGAAQKVYRQEVQRRADPALLEQIGPRQYRLRAFPIPAREIGSLKAPSPLHLWLTYKTFAGPTGYPLPALGERRNVYWSWRSKRTIDGKSAAFDGGWLPPVVPAKVTRVVHVVALADGLIVRAQPLAAAPGLLDPRRIQDRKVAIIIDRSKSMGRVASEARQSLQWLRDTLERANDLDFYLTASPHRGEAATRIDDPAALGPSALLFYGGQRMRDMLIQFSALRADKKYDAILVLTDDGSLDMADDKGPQLALGAPLWMVHLGGHLAAGYDDTTLAAIQKSGGGVATSAADALQALALRMGAAAPAGAAELVSQPVSQEDGMLWTVEPAAAAASGAESDAGLLPLAARQVILHRTRQAQLGKLEVLDELHRLAVQHSVVSAYSSMIVLVNDEQRELLKRAAAEQDRFQREVESGKEIINHPLNPLHVSATPEPHEWLLIMLAVSVLYFAWSSRRRALECAR